MVGIALSYYDVLGVSRDATDDEIKRAYRLMAQIWHPDTNKRGDAEERIKEINEAYETLTDPDRRAEHDQWLDTGPGTGGSAGSDESDDPEPEAFNIRVEPQIIDFGNIRVGASAEAETVLTWDGGSPSSVRVAPPSGTWWQIHDVEAGVNRVTFPIRAEAYTSMSNGRHAAHIDIIVDGVAHRVELVMTIVAAPSKPKPPPPVRPPVPPPVRPVPPPPVVVRPVRRRQGRTTAGLAVVLAVVGVLAYVLWPNTPPPKYLVSDVQAHGAYITDVAYSPNTAMVASAGADNAFDWSNVDGSGAGSAGGYAASCGAVAYTPDNAFLIAGCGAELYAWTVGDPSGNSPTDLGSTDGPVNAIAFAPNHSGGKAPFAVATTKGVELWTYSGDANFDGYTTLPSSSSVVSIAYSASDGPDGTLLAGLSTPQIYGTGRIEIWDVGTDKLLTSFSDPYALQIAFSPDGGTLAISTLTSIQFWNVTTGHLSTIIKYGPYDPLGPGGALAYSPDGAILAFADGWNKIDLWSLNENKLVGSLPASASGQGLAYSLAFSSDSMDLASGGGNSSCSNACDDSSVHIWDVSSFTQ